MIKHICVKSYENQLIISIPRTSVVFTLLCSLLFFSCFLALHLFSLPQSSFTFSDVRYWGGLQKPQWACEVGSLCGREAFCTLAATSGQWTVLAVDCARSLSCITLLLPGRVASAISFRCQVATLEKAASSEGVQGQCLSGKPGWQRVVQPHKIHPASSGCSLLLMPWLSVWWEWKRRSLKGQIAPGPQNERLGCFWES